MWPSRPFRWIWSRLTDPLQRWTKAWASMLWHKTVSFVLHCGGVQRGPSFAKPGMALWSHVFGKVAKGCQAPATPPNIHLAHRAENIWKMLRIHSFHSGHSALYAVYVIKWTNIEIKTSLSTSCYVMRILIHPEIWQATIVEDIWKACTGSPVDLWMDGGDSKLGNEMLHRVVMLQWAVNVQLDTTWATVIRLCRGVPSVLSRRIYWEDPHLS